MGEIEGSDDNPKAGSLDQFLAPLRALQDLLEASNNQGVIIGGIAASKIDIDISMGVLPFEIEMVECSQIKEIGSIQLRLPTPEDLIILKAVAHRTKDLGDIQAIAESHPGLEKERIKYWVQQFGEALDLPDLWSDINKLL